MTVKRLNFTNRSRLTREQANVVVHSGQPAMFDAELNLSHLLETAGSARVFVEAYHRTTRMRFDFGTVSKLQSPPPANRRLTAFEDWEDVNFRVKVTDVTERPGRIIAWANNIRPRGPENVTQNDLVRWKDADLNGRLWDLEFDENGPVVLIEKSLGHAVIGPDRRFIAAAYPEILRRSLTEALLVDRTSGDDPDHWFTEWNRKFLSAKFGIPLAPEDAEAVNDRRDWIEQAVETFGSRFMLSQLWILGSTSKDTE